MRDEFKEVEFYKNDFLSRGHELIKKELYSDIYYFKEFFFYM